MSLVHKYVLRSNRETIKEELDLSVLDHLVGKGILTLELEEDIRAERTRRCRVVRLMNTLECRGPEAFQALVDGLKQKQRHLADMFETWVKEAKQLGKVASLVSKDDMYV